jgi:hypothetical protein
MRKEATAFLCALLVGCASPHFVKLDASGKVDLSSNPDTLKRDLVDCQAPNPSLVACIYVSLRGPQVSQEISIREPNH